MDTKERTADLLTREEAAKYIRVSVASLAAWASSNRYGLPFVKCGRLVRYRQSDLDRWLEARTHGSEAA